ncbi:MAG: hypothetical protein RJA07_2714 [Bacteroidota bacterium]
MTTEKLALFQQFGRSAKHQIKKVETGNVVIYTRVSSKEQADKNLSLETQRKAIEQYAERNKLGILGYFGGTYESAKTDGRKEFNRMLDFIRKSKNKVSSVLVYSIDRFSRTGAKGAIGIVSELREKYGINVFAVTQPTDTSNPSGVLHQNIQLLFSEYDNELRKQKAVAGMKEKLKKGVWIVQPPMGYDIVKINGDRKIVLNEMGKKLKKAFHWKLEGMKNEEILKRLRALGVKPLYKQKIVKIFQNPFYCGLIAHGMLEGEVVEGTHEKMISKEMFLQINNIMKSSSKFGVPHIKENDNIPLKVFMKCEDCEQPFAGYIVKAKGIYYYKCRTNGCRCNKNAKQMHELFTDYLRQFQLDEKAIKPLLFELMKVTEKLQSENIDNEKTIKGNLTELQKKIDILEEKHFVKAEIPVDVYTKFSLKYKQEWLEMSESLNHSGKGISNLQNNLETALNFSTQLSTAWSSANYTTKEKLQKLIFPEGVYYNRQNHTFRTTKINLVFTQIAQWQQLTSENKKGTFDKNYQKSLSAERERFELSVQV